MPFDGTETPAMRRSILIDYDFQVYDGCPRLVVQMNKKWRGRDGSLLPVPSVPEISTGEYVLMEEGSA